MRFAQLGAATALAAACRAFLLVPHITPSETDIIDALPPQQVDGRVLEIDCPSPGCPVAITDIEGKVHLAQVDSILRLNFTVSHTGKDHLLWNGVQIYPIDPQAASLTQHLEADQLVKSSSDTWDYAATPRLGYTLNIRHEVTSLNNEQLDLIAIYIDIFKVGGYLVNGLPRISVKLIQTANGEIFLPAAEVEGAASKLMADAQKCTTVLCKWRAMFTDKLSKLKECAGKARPGIKGSEVKVTSHHDRPRPHGHHRPHRHHHRHGGITRFLRIVVLHVFIPIMIGVVVGVTASLIGMVVGHLIIFIWRILFRRGQRGQYAKVQQQTVAAEDGNDESKSFMDHQGPPPVYEDAPAYEEVVTDGNASM